MTDGQVSVRSPLRVLMLSYEVTEEAGGPGVAASGFASGLARLGTEVTLIALNNRPGRWIMDEALARERGFELRRVHGKGFISQVQGVVDAVAHVVQRDPRPTVFWVNGIWGAQSLAAAIAARLHGLPYVIRPAGSLGTVALKYKRTKKWVYWQILESHVVRNAAAIHCMSRKELAELPPSLQGRAFVVPSGVESPSSNVVPREPLLVGVLARIHPIKRHQEALKAVEALMAGGRDLRLEFAGSVSDQDYEARLRGAIARSPLLTGKVRFLGHVPHEQLATVVGRWRVAMLLSEQENLGHSVLAAAALGVPSVVTPGVALAGELAAADSGVVVEPHEAAAGLDRLLERDPVESALRAKAFAARYSWQGSAKLLLSRLEDLASGTAERST